MQSDGTYLHELAGEERHCRWWEAEGLHLTFVHPSHSLFPSILSLRRWVCLHYFKGSQVIWILLGSDRGILGRRLEGNLRSECFIC